MHARTKRGKTTYAAGNAEGGRGVVRGKEESGGEGKGAPSIVMNKYRPIRIESPSPDPKKKV